MGLLWLTVFPGLVLLGPGWLVSRWCLPNATPLERVATSLLFGLGLIVPLAYVVPYVTRTPIQPLGTGAAALVVALGALALQRFRPRAHSSATPLAGPLGWRTVGGVAAITLLCAWSVIPRSHEAVELWSPCPHQASMYLIEDGTGEGLRAWDAAWGRDVTHLTEHPKEPGYGLEKILTVQRIGSAATFVQHFAFLGSGALPGASVTYFGLIALFAALLAARHVASPALVVLLAALTTFGVRLAGGYMVNENVLAAGLLSGLLWLGLRHRTLDGPLAAPELPLLGLSGVVYALACGVRPELLLVAPVLLALFRPWSPSRLGFVLVAVAVAVTPWLLTNAESFGQALYHPSLDRGRTAMTLFGYQLNYHPLNWPFADGFLRPEGHSYPNALLLPLRLLQDLGLALWTLVLIGLARVRWPHRLLLASWSAPIAVILVTLVYTDHDKLSYAVMCLGPVPYLAGLGVAALRASDTRRLRLAALGTLVGLALVPQALRGLDLSVDPRQQLDDGRPSSREHQLSEDEERAALHEVHLLPNLDINDASLGLEISMSLAWHASPPQRRAQAIATPVHVWCEFRPCRRAFVVEPMAAPSLAMYIVDPNDFGNGRDYVPFSLAVETAATEVHVELALDDGLTLRLDTRGAASGPRRYVTIGLLQDGASALPEVDVTLDGRAVALQATLARLPSGERRTIVVGNHPWRYREVERRLELVAEPWPDVPCPEDTSAEVSLGPGFVIDRREAHRGEVVLFHAARFPDEDGPTCPGLGPEDGPERR